MWKNNRKKIGIKLYINNKCSCDCKKKKNKKKILHYISHDWSPPFHTVETMYLI